MKIPELKDINLVAVYGTLKKAWPAGMPYGNHSAMKRAGWRYVKDSWVEFSHINWGGFPIAKFETGTDKLLQVELYNVPREWVEWPLDSLEGHPTFYFRKEVVTTDGDTVVIYEYRWDVQDISEEFKLDSNVEDADYYSWNK